MSTPLSIESAAEGTWLIWAGSRQIGLVMRRSLNPETAGYQAVGVDLEEVRAPTDTGRWPTLEDAANALVVL